MRFFSLALVLAAACGSKTPAADTSPAPTVAPAPTTPPTSPPTSAPGSEVGEADTTVAAAADDVAPAPPSDDVAAPAPSPTAPIAVTGACLEALDDGAPITALAEVGGGVRFCRMMTDDSWSCWVLDLATRTLATTETPAALAKPAEEVSTPRFPAGLKVEDDGKKASWCPPSAGGTCHALALAGMTVGQAGVNGERVLVAPPYDGGTAPGALDARVFGADGALVGTIPLADADNGGCPDVRWAGSSVYVSLGVCAGPGATGWLADPVTGKRRAWLGGGEESIAAYDVMPVMVAPEVAAFREQYGDEVVFHDTTTGAVIRRTDLRVLRAKDETGELIPGAPEEGEMVSVSSVGDGATAGDDGKKTLVVTNGDRLRDMVVTLDGTTGAITSVLKLPRCPAPP